MAKGTTSGKRAPRNVDGPKAPKTDALVVLTVGHSTRPILEFIQLLGAHGVTLVVDVRTVPRSRHNPQFNRDTLPGSLEAAGIDYVHKPELGGLRRTTADSVNGGWRNTSFRGYADYMQTPEFAEGIKALLKLAKRDRVALMCAEAVPWRCHRSLIADALLVRGVSTEHIMSVTQRRRHVLTPFAKVNGTRITYPPIDAAPAAISTPAKQVLKKTSRKIRARATGKTQRP